MDVMIPYIVLSNMNISVFSLLQYSVVLDVELLGKWHANEETREGGCGCFNWGAQKRRMCFEWLERADHVLPGSKRYFHLRPRPFPLSCAFLVNHSFLITSGHYVSDHLLCEGK